MVLVNSASATLRFLKDLTRDEQDDRVISSVSDDRGGVHVVSRFRDQTWDLRPLLDRLDVGSWDHKLDFSSIDALPDGARLTDSQHEPLLRSVKAFLYSLMYERQLGHRPAKVTTLRGYFYATSTLVRWMLAEGLSSFADLTPKRLEGFAAHVRRPVSGGGEPSPGYLFQRLRVVEVLFQQRSVLRDAIREHPWLGESTQSMVGRDRTIGAKTDPIPLKVATKLFTAAEKCLLECEPVLRAARARVKLARRYPSGGKARDIAFKTAAQFYGFTDMQAVVQREIPHLRTACAIVILGFSGMRSSELLNLRSDCLERTLGKDGEVFFWIKGMTFKLSSEPHPHRWMVPPLVHRAVKILRILTSEFRRAHEENEDGLVASLNSRHLSEEARRTTVEILERVRALKGCLFFRLSNSASGGCVSVITNGRLNDALQLFVERNEIREDRGGLWSISSHQFRRTMARFVAATTFGDLRYLRQHFDHWTLEMTAYYAADGQTDDDLIQMIHAERSAYQTELMTLWLDEDEPLAGGAGARLTAFRSGPDVMTFKDAGSLARVLSDSGSVQIRGTGHGYCLSANRGCGGQGLYDSALCVTCSEAVIDRRFAPFWRSVRGQAEKLLVDTQDILGEPTRKRCEVYRDMANQVLAVLDGASVSLPETAQ